MSVNNFTRVFDLIQYNKTHFSSDNFIHGKIKDKWVHYSLDEFIEKVNLVSMSLVNMGLHKGSRAAIISPNRPEWSICDFAIMQVGAYQIPLYPTLAAHDIEFIVNDAEINVIFAADEQLYNKILSVTANIDREIHVFTFDEVKGANNWDVLFTPTKEVDIQPYKDAINEDDVLTIIYTSGTTGTPKGVMLTHKNLVSNVVNSAVIFPAGVKRVVSFLPLSHIFERMICYLYVYLGIEINYVENMDTLVPDIQFVKPDGFSCVPRLLEKIYEKIMEKGKSLTGIKRALFFWSIDMAESFEMDKGWWYNFKLKIARKLVFSKWKDVLGGNVQILVSGGAALNPRLCKIFWAAGLPVYEGYGLTETSPVISVNEPKFAMFGTVGKPIKGVEVKIAEDGEILVRGHNIMKGYYKRPDLTEQCIDKDGWFYTGDIGELVNHAYLKITDRKKEIFKTAGGKYIAPQTVENKFIESPFIEQIMVLGENRKFPTALIVPAFPALKNWCKKKGIVFTSNEELVKDQQVLDKYFKEMEIANATFGRWEQIKAFSLLTKEWSIDGGELTPKLSLKRKVILEKNKTLIDKMYQDAEAKYKSTDHV